MPVRYRLYMLVVAVFVGLAGAGGAVLAQSQLPVKSGTQLQSGTPLQSGGAAEALAEVAADNASANAAGQNSVVQHSALQHSAGERNTLTHDRQERHYYLYVPEKGAGTARPLVVVLHGGGGNPQSIAETTGFSVLADRYGFLVAYPLGMGRVPTWNAGKCCGYAERQNVDDVGFIGRMVSDIQKRYTVDANRIYATGLADGGMMAYRLACEHSGLFRAVAPVAAPMHTYSCEAAGRPSVVMFHALDDRNAPYSGGLPDRSARSFVNRRAVADPSVGDTVQFWVKNNFCRNFPAIEELADGEVQRVTYYCAEGRQVELNTLKTGGHSWPGGSKHHEGADTPNPRVQATEEIWRFFRKHPPTELF